jgi:hypothetical protein
MILDILTNTYVIPIIASIIGLVILYVYDKFEKKQYSNSIYLRIGILIYISCLATIYISKSQFFIGSSIQNGGNSSNICDPQTLLQQPNEIRNNRFEQFKTGVPTF